MSKNTYLNSFFEGAGGHNNKYARQYIEGEFVENFLGLDIFTSHAGFGVMQFDIVLNGVCIGMYAGINGARARCKQLQEIN